MSGANKNFDSQKTNNKASSQHKSELIEDTELRETIQELELSPEDLDEIAGGNVPAYGHSPREV